MNLFRFLNQHRQIKVEIGGHTNMICGTSFCDELSKNRARAVANYFIKKGIKRDRITYKGYGKRQPITRDRSPVTQARNQRVELKITDVVKID